jgi:hypothetical protein
MLPRIIAGPYSLKRHYLHLDICGPKVSIQHILLDLAWAPPPPATTEVGGGLPPPPHKKQIVCYSCVIHELELT